MYDAVIIGGGAVGCAVARELSRWKLKICLAEQGEDVCVGTSKANSAIVHAGFDAPAGSMKARFNVEGSRRMEALSRELDFPYRRNGALVVCFEEAGLPRLEELLQRGRVNGVEGLEILRGGRLHELEPALSEKAVAALYAPTSAIICPFGMTIALAENAAHNGAEFRFDTRVETIRRAGEGYVLETSRGPLETRAVISAAGVWGDVLHNQVCGDTACIVPRRGEYCMILICIHFFMQMMRTVINLLIRLNRHHCMQMQHQMVIQKILKQQNLNHRKKHQQKTKHSLQSMDQ